MNLIFVVLLLFIIGSTNNYEKFQKELGPEKSEALEKLLDSFDAFLLKNYPNENTSVDRIESFLLTINNQQFNKTWMFNLSIIDTALRKMEKTGLRKDMYLFRGEEYAPSYNIKKFLPENEADSHKMLSNNVEEFEDIKDIPPPDQQNKHNHEEKNDLARKRKEMKKNIESSPTFNSNGKFIYALVKSNQNDTSIINYVDIKHTVFDLSPSIIASGFLNNIGKDDYDDIFNKLILVVEIYYPMILYQKKINEGL